MFVLLLFSSFVIYSEWRIVEVLSNYIIVFFFFFSFSIYWYMVGRAVSEGFIIKLLESVSATWGGGLLVGLVRLLVLVLWVLYSVAGLKFLPFCW